MDSIFIWSPIIFGLAIGWIIVYFTRKFSDFSANSLKKVASVAITGTGFCALTFFNSSEIGSKVMMYYLLAIGIGIMLHWLYQLIISLCFKKDFANKYIRYSLMTECNLSEEQFHSKVEVSDKATELMKVYRLWRDNKLTDAEFKNFIINSNITKNEYNKIKSGDCVIPLCEEAILAIKLKGYEDLFKKQEL